MFSLANTSCTCNHDNCFRFSNKANKNLIRFRLPLPKNKLHSSYISFISWNKKDEKLSLWNFSSCLLCKLAFCSWDICVLVYKWKFNPLTIHFCEIDFLPKNSFFTQEFLKLAVLYLPNYLSLNNDNVVRGTCSKSQRLISIKNSLQS